MPGRSESVLRCRGSVRDLAPLLCLLAIPLLIGIAATMKNAAAWPLAGIMLVFHAGLIVLVRCFRFEIADGTLSYRSLFGGTRSIRLDEIDRARFEVGCFRYTDRFRPPIRIAVKPRKSSAARAFDINVKVFSHPDAMSLLDALRSTSSRD